MSDLRKELEEMKTKLENLAREKVRAETILEQQMAQLRGLGVESIEEGWWKVNQLKEQKEQAETKGWELVNKFKQDFEAFL